MPARAFLYWAMQVLARHQLRERLIKFAIEKGIKCIYFPCYLIKNLRISLKKGIENFLQSLVPEEDPHYILDYMKNTNLIILDGCNEAATFGEQLGSDIKDLAKGRLKGATVNLREKKDRISIPSDLTNNMELESYQKKYSKVCPNGPLRYFDFSRLKLSNPSIRRDIDKFESEYEKVNCPLIITTRDDAPLSLPMGFYRMSLNPFTEEQLNEFITKWFKKSKTSIIGLIEFLESNPHVKEICRRPLIATMVVTMHEKGFDLPHSKSEVYAQRFQLLLRDWDYSKGVPHRNIINSNDKMMLLTRLAYMLHSKKKRQFSKMDIEEIWLSGFKHLYSEVTVDYLLWELRVCNGIIELQEEGTYSLGHLSFQEFLAARGVLLFGGERALMERFYDPWWREVFIFFAGLSGDISKMLETFMSRFGLDENNGMLREMTAEARFTSPVILDFVRNALEDGVIQRSSKDVLEEEDYLNIENE